MHLLAWDDQKEKETVWEKKKSVYNSPRKHSPVTRDFLKTGKRTGKEKIATDGLEDVPNGWRVHASMCSHVYVCDQVCTYMCRYMHVHVRGCAQGTEHAALSPLFSVSPTPSSFLDQRETQRQGWRAGTVLEASGAQ